MHQHKIMKLFSVKVTIELITKKRVRGISWSLLGTDCKSKPNLQLSANKKFRIQCALAIGHLYTLKCNSTGAGWDSNYLVIEDTVYCEYATTVTFTNITISGNV